MVQDNDRITQLNALRRRYGWDGAQRISRWSKEMLARAGKEEGLLHLPSQLTEEEQREHGDLRPKNIRILEEISRRFPGFFVWEAHGKKVRFLNFPMIGGDNPTLFDLLLIPEEFIDGYTGQQEHTVQGSSEFCSVQRIRMNNTGIGYKGMRGVSWLPATEPFLLPLAFKQEIQALGEVIFLLCDAITELYSKNPQVAELLSHKVPLRILRSMGPGTIDVMRPDIVIVKEEDGALHPVVTEIESAPAGHGIVHAVGLGYNLPTDIVDCFLEYLEGRPYLVFATHQWAEYIWDQAAFCSALREHGVDARLLFDTPLVKVHERAQHTWVVPKDASQLVKDAWDSNLLGRLNKLGFEEFVSGTDVLPDTVGNAVVFRFGYFDNFSTETLTRMLAWQKAGATLINPIQFPLESKTLMAAIGLPAVRSWIEQRDRKAIEILDRCVAETKVLDPRFMNLDLLTADRNSWVMKFAAWDGDNRSWGSRSLEVGSQHRASQWERIVEAYLRLPYPVVAQRKVTSARFDVRYAREDGGTELLLNALTRLSPFFLRRKDGQTMYGGGGLTLRAGTFRIHGATDAVEAPVIFQERT